MMPQFLHRQSVPSETYLIYMDNHRFCLNGMAFKFVFSLPQIFLHFLTHFEYNQKSLSPDVGQSSMVKYLYFWSYPNFLKTQCKIS